MSQSKAVYSTKSCLILDTLHSNHFFDLGILSAAVAAVSLCFKSWVFVLYFTSYLYPSLKAVYGLRILLELLDDRCRDMEVQELLRKYKIWERYSWKSNLRPNINRSLCREFCNSGESCCWDYGDLDWLSIHPVGWTLWVSLIGILVDAKLSSSDNESLFLYSITWPIGLPLDMLVDQNIATVM